MEDCYGKIKRNASWVLGVGSGEERVIRYCKAILHFLKLQLMVQKTIVNATGGLEADIEAEEAQKRT